MLKTLSIILIVFVLIFCYASYVEPNRLITKEVKIEMIAPVENIVFFTDTHL